jgi:hypothetical protein
MVHGGTPVCLSDMSNIEISTRNEYTPISKGFDITEQSLRITTVVLFLIMMFIIVIVLIFTIFKSLRQKEVRLEYFKYNEINT